MRLSDAGRQLLPQVLGVLDRTREIEAMGRGEGSEASPMLVLGASMTIGNHLLPPLLRRYLVLHKGKYLSAGLRATLGLCGIDEV